MILRKLLLIILLAFNTLTAKENALALETSPYLKRHAHNPVNWHAWNQESLALAKKQDKAIFLSIGYSTCHWCHVMEEESFEKKDVAEVLNRYFIAIKVDKEELPHIDKKYQNLFRAYKGSRGGWPLSVFLTPDLKPFYITGYMPRESMGGVEDILTLTTRLGKLYGEKKRLQKALKVFDETLHAKKRHTKPSQKSLDLKALIKTTMQHLTAEYDKENSGFGTGRTKFPESSKIELLLNIYKTTGDKKAFEMAKQTLLTMSKRGIFDQIDGGFFRYSGKDWTIPHFQKLLYVNAQMPLPYLEFYRLTGEKYYHDIAKMTIDEIERRYTDNGLYISASDSISKEGDEGVYYLYHHDRVLKALLEKGFTKEEAEDILAYLGIEEFGNYDGEDSHVTIAQEGEIPAKLQAVKKILQEIRSCRDFPLLDKKIITAWNAMMIKALYTLGMYDRHYLSLAEKRLKTLQERMFRDGTLYHQTIANKAPKQEALLEDYAYLIDTLLTAHQVTLNESYLALASQLAHKAKALFLREGTWYMNTSTPKVKADFDDKYYSSALSVLLNSFVILANLNDDFTLLQESEKVLKKEVSILEDKPQESASLVTLALRLKVGDITLKAPISALKKEQKEFLKIRYPFILRHAHHHDTYMACKLGLCFASAKHFEAIYRAIDKAKEEIDVKPKKIIWGQ